MTYDFNMSLIRGLNDLETPQSPTNTTSTNDCSTKVDEKFGVLHSNESPAIQDGIIMQERGWRPFFSGIKNQTIVSQLCKFGRKKPPPADIEQGHITNPGMPDDFFQSRMGNLSLPDPSNHH